jgi:hypothetical protein
MRAARFLFSLLVLSASWPAGAGVLYKSIAANGTVTFSDTPPAAGAKLVEQREVRSSGAVAESNAGPTMGVLAVDSDGELARASAQLDQAEHALAIARRDLWSPRDGLQLAMVRRSASDDARLATCKRDVVLARQALMQVLKERQAAALVPGMPYTLAAR